MSDETILIIDDDAEVRSLMSDVLSDENYKTELAQNEKEAVSLIKKSVPDLIFLDLWIREDELAGLTILKIINKMYPDIPIVIISGHGTIDVAVQAIQKGAFDFIEKPFVIDRLLLTCKRALETSKLRRENFVLKHGGLNSEIFFVGTSHFALSMRSMLEKIASTSGRVLINSKVGIGADTIAFEIHKKSCRKDFPFINVNCFSDDNEKFEAELFGTEKLCGYIEKANSGTLFLEDITKLTKSCQSKLLHFLQANTFLAENRKVYPNIRLICSSNDNSFLLSDEFNNELFYRINVINMDIPSIKDRREDILPIVDYYLSNSVTLFGLKAKNFTKGALAILQSYDWPGNIHQIKNVVESSLINAGELNEIDKDSLPSELISNTEEKFSSSNVTKLISTKIKEAKEYFEADYLRMQFSRFSGNVSKTAEFVGMERSALHRKLKAFGIKYDKNKKTDKNVA